MKSSDAFDTVFGVLCERIDGQATIKGSSILFTTCVAEWMFSFTEESVEVRYSEHGSLESVLAMNIWFMVVGCDVIANVVRHLPTRVINYRDCTFI